jgi:quinol monooxygenase YgiN
MAEPIVYIDRSQIRPGQLDNLKSALKVLAEFVHEHNPKILDYRIFIDEAASTMVVVGVHPDAAALEFHIEVGREAFRKVGPMISLRSIEVFGRVGSRLAQQLRDKADMLGEGAAVAIHESFAGFSR